MSRALSILRDEHRSISAVLQGMEYFVQAIRVRRTTIDPRVFRAMLHYLDTFSERMHHPKEDRYLFREIRERSAGSHELIAELEEDHVRGEEALRRLAQVLIRYEEGGEREFPALEREVENFARNYRDHMRREEDLLFPIAQEVLTAGDWSRLDITLAEGRDPLAVGRDTGEFGRFFDRIVELAPPPIGLGRTRSGDSSL